MLSRAAQYKRENRHQLIFFSFVFYLTNLIGWGYYNILLLQESGNAVEVVFLNQGMMYVGVMLGFILSGRFFSQLGYLNNFRFANALDASIIIVTVLTLPSILEIHLPIAVFRGVVHGIFWNSRHLFNTREVNGAERSQLISLLYSLEAFMIVAMPILVATMIETTGFEIVFVLSALINIFALVYPWSHNKIPKDTLAVSDFKLIRKRPGFYRWAALLVGQEILTNQRVLALIVLPFLFIGDIFGVGLFISAVGLVGVFLALWRRKDNRVVRLKWGYVGAGIVTTATLGLIYFWTLPALIVRDIFAKLGFAMYSPAESDLNYRNRELMTGDMRQQLGLEIQQYSELFMFVARMINLIMFLFVFFVFKVDQETVLKVILIISLLREIPSLYSHAKLNESLRRGKSSEVHPEALQSHGHKGLGYV